MSLLFVWHLETNNLWLKLLFFHFRFLDWFGCILMRWRFVFRLYNVNLPIIFILMKGKLVGSWLSSKFILKIFNIQLFSAISIKLIIEHFSSTGHSRGPCWPNSCCLWCWLCIRFFFSHYLGICISKILYFTFVIFFGWLYVGLEFFGSGLYFLKCGILGEQI
jgi:hypothetical protein